MRMLLPLTLLLALAACYATPLDRPASSNIDAAAFRDPNAAGKGGAGGTAGASGGAGGARDAGPPRDARGDGSDRDADVVVDAAASG